MQTRDGVAVFCAHTELANIETVTPNPRNPNTHPEAQVRLLASIIEAQGWRNPIVVSIRSGFIVKGHGRLMAARSKGWTQVPIDRQAYESEAAEYADMVADNRIAELAEIDEDVLKGVIRDVSDAGFDTMLTGFDNDALVKLFANEEEVVAPVPEYPIAAKLNERYDYVMIVCENETDFAYLQTITGAQQERSYKNSHIGLGRVVPFRAFMTTIAQHAESLRAHLPEHP